MQKVVGSNPISRSSGSPLVERASAFRTHCDKTTHVGNSGVTKLGLR